MIHGYARVSTAAQANEGTSLESQEEALTAAGAERLWVDRGVSGAKASRPELDRMLDQLRDGDVVVVTKLDRMGRSLEHLITLVNKFEKMGVTFKALGEGIDSSTSAGRMMLGVFGALAEFERDRIRERTETGRAAAKAQGRQGGRPKLYTADKINEVKALHANEALTLSQKISAAGVSRSTYYRLLNEGTDEAIDA